MGDSAYDFLGMIIDSAGGSACDRTAFKVYALQRLHAANFRGVTAVINSRPVIRTGPNVPPGLGLQPLGTARPKPAINFRSLRGIARQAINTTKNHSGWARLLLDRARDLIIHGPARRGADGAAIPTDEGDKDGHFFFNHPERGGYPTA